MLLSPDDDGIVGAASRGMRPVETQLDRRCDQVDPWLERFNRKGEEWRAQTESMLKAQHADFIKLYDFMRADAERMEAQLDQLHAAMVARFTDLQSAVLTLAARRRRPRRR